MQLIERHYPRRLNRPKWSVALITGFLLGAFVLPVPAWSSGISELPPPFQEKIADARKACAEFNNGEFSLGWRSVDRVDLDGDLRSDWVLNEIGFACSTAASLYCGTGGCMSHFLIGDELHSQLNQGWELVTFGPHRVLLADVHGSKCGGINPTPCVTASIWDADQRQWRTTAGDWE
jgi:hypothetical protein